MLMPKTSVNKNDFLSTSKNHVWFARKVLPMQSISISHFKNKSADKQFRVCILTAYPPHVFTSIHRNYFLLICLVSISEACLGNLFTSHSKTFICSEPGARLICASNFAAAGRSRVIFAAPSLHTEQIALKFEGSSVPPIDLSIM